MLTSCHQRREQVPEAGLATTSICNPRGGMQATWPPPRVPGAVEKTSLVPNHQAMSSFHTLLEAYADMLCQGTHNTGPIALREHMTCLRLQASPRTQQQQAHLTNPNCVSCTPPSPQPE